MEDEVSTPPPRNAPSKAACLYIPVLTDSCAGLLFGGVQVLQVWPSASVLVTPFVLTCLLSLFTPAALAQPRCGRPNTCISAHENDINVL